eukprot:3212771-Pyramimonas_sp.AAC.1
MHTHPHTCSPVPAHAHTPPHPHFQNAFLWIVRWRLLGIAKPISGWWIAARPCLQTSNCSTLAPHVNRVHRQLEASAFEETVPGSELLGYCTL